MSEAVQEYLAEISLSLCQKMQFDDVFYPLLYVGFYPQSGNKKIFDILCQQRAQIN